MSATVGAEALQIRPITPDDKAVLEEAFEHLSDESRYRRFLSPHGRLSRSELRYFTEIDHRDHEALVAFNRQTGQGIGVARYVRTQEDPDVAELAVAVVDEWQGRGVGTRLVGRLAERAREEGITSFSAVMLADNDSMWALLAEIGRVEVLHSEHGTVEVVVNLRDSGVDRLKRLLAAVARGEALASPLRVRAQIR